jgi:hypothetical protein
MLSSPSKILGMDAGVLPWGSLVFDAFKGLFPFLRLARPLHQGAMRDLKLAMCGAPDDVLVYAHSYLLAPTADRTSDREFPAHEQCLSTIVAIVSETSARLRAHPTHAGARLRLVEAIGEPKAALAQVRFFVLSLRDHFIALRDFGMAERASSSTLMPESASENAFSALAKIGSTA